MVLSFAPGLLGILAGVVTAALLMAFGVLGFAVLHAITQTMNARGFLLGGAYAAVLVFGWPVLVMCLLGLADMFFDLRGRAARQARRPAGALLRFTFNMRNSAQQIQIKGATTMEVILLERISKLGQMGDVVRVRDGFARNFLLPRGKALRATAENKERFESMKAELQAKNLEAKSGAEKLAAGLDGKTVTVLRQASETGQLYGSVSTRDIASLVNADGGTQVTRGQVELNTPIKSIGQYKVPLTLHPEVETVITVIVARSNEEAERIARGENVLIPRDEAEEAAAQAPPTAESFFEEGAEHEEQAEGEAEASRSRRGEQRGLRLLRRRIARSGVRAALRGFDPFPPARPASAWRPDRAGAGPPPATGERRRNVSRSSSRRPLGLFALGLAVRGRLFLRGLRLGHLGRVGFRLVGFASAGLGGLRPWPPLLGASLFGSCGLRLVGLLRGIFGLGRGRLVPLGRVAVRMAAAVRRGAAALSTAFR